MKFISIPLKEAEPTDWVKPLKAYLAQVYGSASSDFEHSVVEFDKLRNDTIHAEKDDIAKELYYRYYGQLELLEMRVPLEMLKIEFEWSDAFSSEVTVKQHSVAFEKASVLFNLASLLSYLASKSYPDDLKQSYANFQKSAGVFDFIQKNFMHAPSKDMKVDSIAAFVKLMLAQAQEAFLLKYLNSGLKLKSSLCARLAQSASNFYSSSQELTSQVEFFPAELDDYCKLKQLYYQSVAHYYEGKDKEEKEEYGVALTYLKAAESDMDTYKRYDLSYDPEFIETMKDHLDIVKSDYKQMDKNNDFIYHENVPKLASLPAIKPLDSGKPIPLSDQNVQTLVGHDLFERIIPMSVHEKSSLYSEDKAQILRNEDDRCATATEEYNSTLEFLKLPQSLSQLRLLFNTPTTNANDEEIDPRVLGIASEISTSHIDQSKIKTLRLDIDDIVRQTNKLLADDRSRYVQAQKKYGAGWTQEEYSSELIQIKEELGKVQKSLAEAGESDRTIERMYVKNKAALDLLALGPSNPKFLHSFQGDDDTAKITQQVSLLDIDEDTTPNPNIRKDIDEIDSKIRELGKLQKERFNTLTDLKSAVRDDDISNILVLNRDGDDKDLEKLFSKELQKFKPYQERIAVTLDKQKEAIATLKQLMSKVLDDPAVKSRMKKNEQSKSTMQRQTSAYLDAYESWKTYKSGCEQAPAFYKQLLQFATNLKYKVERFVGQRANEGNRIIQAAQASNNYEGRLLQQSLGRYSMSDSKYEVPQSSGIPSQGRMPQPSSFHQPTGSAPPPLPSKPQPRKENGDFYSTPSAYDPSLYSKFGNRNWGH